MGQSEIITALKENLYLDIKGLRDSQQTTGNGTFKAITQMIKYKEVKGISANNGDGHRVVFYTLKENYNKAFKKIDKIYKQFGEIKEFIPIAVNRLNYVKKTKLGRLNRHIK
jgi:hypothetical protein